jgi:biopolymer transport protein ExbD
MHRRRLPHSAFRVPADAPISALNTTPLIDVMLVLLIMFIVTIPIMTHSVKIDLPTKPGVEQAKPEVHLLEMRSNGALSWDGSPVAEAALPARLAAVAERPQTVLHFRTDGEARYEDFDRVLAAVRRAGIDRLGFPGNEDFAETIRR